MDVKEKELKKARELGFFEKYLSLWVLLCMAAGISLGYLFPGARDVINSWQIAQVSIPVAVLLFFMMYPIMVKIDFSQVVEVVKAPKAVILTLVINWAIKPFTMVFFAWLFMKKIFSPFIAPVMQDQYMAGMILLGIAPCTAMVLVWSWLSKGRMAHTLVMVAINSLTMLFLYAPLGSWLLGVAKIPVPFLTIALAVLFYVGIPLIAGYISRTQLIKHKGIEWYENVFLRYLGDLSIIALLATLIVLFMLQGQVIIQQPLIILMIAVPLFIQTMFIFLLGYGASIIINLPYRDAAPASMIGASNHFEVAIATAATLFGLEHGAALATVVGVLIEVPVMLFLVRICLKTNHWFRDSAYEERF